MVMFPAKAKSEKYQVLFLLLWLFQNVIVIWQTCNIRVWREGSLKMSLAPIQNKASNCWLVGEVERWWMTITVLGHTVITIIPPLSPLLSTIIWYSHRGFILTPFCNWRLLFITQNWINILNNWNNRLRFKIILNLLRIS